MGVPLYHVCAYQAKLPRYQNSRKSGRATGETRGYLSWLLEGPKGPVLVSSTDPKFWELAETHLLVCVSVCELKGSMAHLPSRLPAPGQTASGQLQEGFTLHICMYSLLIDLYLVQLHGGKDEIIGAVCVSAECFCLSGSVRLAICIRI